MHTGVLGMPHRTAQAAAEASAEVLAADSTAEEAAGKSGALQKPGPVVVAAEGAAYRARTERRSVGKSLSHLLLLVGAR